MAEGNRVEEDRLGGGTAPPLPPQAFPHAQPRAYSPRQQYTYHSGDAFLPTAAPFDQQATTPHHTIASYAAANLQAAAANAAAVSPLDPYTFTNSSDPDDFYRDYRAAQPTVSSPTSTALQPSLMASTTLPLPHPHPPSHPHTRLTTPAIRVDSRGNLTSKLPNPVLPAGSTGLRPALRSASTPLDDRSSGHRAVASSGYGPSKQPSVKDLKKRFDQSAAASDSAPPPAVRKPSTRPTKEGLPQTRLAGPAAVSGHVASASSYTALRSSTSRDAGTDSPRAGLPLGRSQRQKFSEEDQLSNNSQSFASRVRGPRTTMNQTVPTKGQASKVASLPTQSPPPHPPVGSPSLSPPGPRSNGGPLLFGEILAQDNNTHRAGFGIDGVRPRRTSEPHLPSPTAFDRSDPADVADDSPSSPTDWYRGVASQSRDGRPPTKGSRIPQSTPTAHGRGLSDGAASAITKPPLAIRLPAARQNVSNSPMSSPSSPSSRLPMSVKQRSMHNDRSSPSSRSGSPSSVQHLPPSGRSSRQHNLPTKRAKTPTIPGSAARAKTPTHNATSGRKAAPSKIATTTPGASGNTRLAAYISAPPPKLSPPLRSSRPRQPVSTASTTSSRLKTVDRAQTGLGSSSGRPGSKDEEASKRRRISVGPIDFAQRRETIKLAYSKSIRESQAREARQAAAQRRKRENEAAAKAKAEAETAAAAVAEGPVGPMNEETKDGNAPPSSFHIDKDGEEKLLEAATPAPSIQPPTEPTPKPSSDSPTLGMPGSFPSFASSNPEPLEDEPLSAVTEFDNEPQTDAPLPENASLYSQEGPGLGIASPAQSVRPQEKATYRSPFDELGTTEDDSVSIKISLDTRSPPQTMDRQLSIPIITDYDETKGEPHVPGSFRDDLDGPNSDWPASRPASPPQENGNVPEALSRTQSPAKTVPASPARRQATSPVKQPLTSPAKSIRHGHQQQEYEPVPFIPLSQTTTVTILSRDSDFTPLGHAPSTPPRPPKPQADHLLRRSAERLRELHAEEARAAEPHMDSLEDFYVGPHVGDNVSALRDSPSLQSEFSDDQTHAFPEVYRANMESGGHTLSVPGLLSPANRTSQLSAWTDFSLDSASDGGRDRNSKNSVVISRDSTVRGRPAMLPVASRPASFTDGCSSHDDELQYSPRHGRSEEHLTPSEYSGGQRRLEVNTGDGFSVDYLPAGVSNRPSGPTRPAHEPPPTPTPDNRSVHEGRRTPSSGYYDHTRPSSYFQSSKDDDSTTYSVGPSRRESDDYTQPILTPKSTDQTSLESAGAAFSMASTLDGDRKISMGDELKDQADGDKHSVASREKSRLTQRQNVIKELIDTEAVFVRDMSVVEEIYKGTAEACPRLDGKTVKLIFRNTDEIIAFHTTFLAELKEAVSSVYTPKGRRSPLGKDREDSMVSDTTTVHSSASNPSRDGPRDSAGEPDDSKDRQTSIGPVFVKHVDQMRQAHEGFLRTSDLAAKRLIQIQEDKTVKVWLDECNEVAKDLTAAWNLDSLLIKPMQRITKYPNLISQLLQYTPDDHPDREALVSARTTLENAILDINKTKKNFELVGQIVGRKRKESDVRAGFARAFGKRVDKLQTSANNRPTEDPEYQRLNEKFGDDYLRLQVVLRDVEFYTRQVSAYVHEFLQYLSAMELVMRLQPSPYPEIESKWSRFNVSMRDMEKVALDQHLAQVRKHVIEPFELVIKCYNNPSTAMKKRAKRRLDYERAEQLRKSGKKVDKQLGELVEQYDALNETLKKELPKLSAHTERIGNICLGNFVCIQVKWFSIWKEKVKVVLGDAHVPEFSEVVTMFQREFREMEDQIGSIGILNPSLKPRSSQSTADETRNLSVSSSSTRARSRPRPAEISPRPRGMSLNHDQAPCLPTPDFVRSNSGHFILSPGPGNMSPHHYYYRDQYSGIGLNSAGRPGGSASPGAPSPGHPTPTRPGTGLSYDSSIPAPQRPSVDSAAALPHSGGKNNHLRQDSASTYNSSFPAPQPDTRRFSGLFHSALPVSDEQEEQRQAAAQQQAQSLLQVQSLLQAQSPAQSQGFSLGLGLTRSRSRSRSRSQRPSRASSRERQPATLNGYNVLWLAASLFEFNIEDTKHEAGYPYLTYQAGEIFDVIAEKGELWLAKNQDDPASLVGWIWSKHFAKLADS